MMEAKSTQLQQLEIRMNQMSMLLEVLELRLASLEGNQTLSYPPQATGKILYAKATSSSMKSDHEAQCHPSSQINSYGPNYKKKTVNIFTSV